MSEQLLTVKEASTRLNAGTGMVYDLVAGRRLRSCRIGRGRGVIRIPESALAEYLDGVTTPARNLVVVQAPRRPKEDSSVPWSPVLRRREGRHP